MAIPVNKADERDESKRNRLLSPGGQKGFLRSRRKWMNPIPEKFANVLVSRVYLVNQLQNRQSLARVPHPCAAFCARVGFHSRRPLGIFLSHMTENWGTSRLSPDYHAGMWANRRVRIQKFVGVPPSPLK